jgi:hypothetical protein
MLTEGRERIGKIMRSSRPRDKVKDARSSKPWQSKQVYSLARGPAFFSRDRQPSTKVNEIILTVSLPNIIICLKPSPIEI